ncbi:OmpA family protein [Desulfococcaceae bacterium HSG8]|nr:OmpA family protein [Desulfococcaceae bacterium HSG8]
MKTHLFYLFLILSLGISAAAQDTPLSFPDTREKITEALRKNPLGRPKSFVSSEKSTPSGIENDSPRVGALIRFDFDSDTIRKDSYPLLREFGESFQKDLPDAAFVIEGHADSKGTDEYNNDLSRRRADAVKTFLISAFKIDESRLKIRAYGESRPIVSNETEEGRALNRRVEFVRMK